LIELNKIHSITWQEGFTRIPDKSVDLIITSPPYNMGKKLHTGSNYMDTYNTYNDNLPEEEYQQGQITFLNECFRVLKDNGSMFYNHKPRIRNGVSIHPLSWVLNSDFILKQEIIWRNGSQNFDKIRYYPMTERVYWLTKDVKTKLYNSVGLSDIWEFKNSRRDKLHKATFPIDLPLSIIKCFEEAEIILDPYMGIGTTAKAVIECNREDNKSRKYIGFEIDSTYVERATNDINEVLL
jgi:site-specific DNA-methyltransferase (adenine-specific)